MKDLLVVAISCYNMDFDVPASRVFCLDKRQVTLRSSMPNPVLVIVGLEPSKILLTFVVITLTVRNPHLDLAPPGVLVLMRYKYPPRTVI